MNQQQRPDRPIRYPAHLAGVLVATCVMAALLTPSPDAISMFLLWLVLAVGLGLPYFGVLWLLRRRRRDSDQEQTGRGD
jgi:Sec-independent protein secretion pathway component TatC